MSAHRTYISVYSPYARHGQVVHTLGSTVSVPKTIEEILDLPPMSYGDLLANDLLDYFRTTPRLDGYSAVAKAATPAVAAWTRRIWDLTSKLDTSGYDQDTRRLGRLTDLYFASLRLSGDAPRLGAAEHHRRQEVLYAQARAILRQPR